MIFPIKDISWKEIALFTNDLSAIYKKLYHEGWTET